MNVPRRFLRLAYAAIALLALCATWSHNLAYLNLGPIGGTLHFWQETLANPASRSITVDIFFYSLAVTVWMVLEARRLRMRGVWIYVLLGVLVAVSFTFPLFMSNRERALEAIDNSSVGGTLRPGDVVALVVTTAGVLAFAVWSFLR